MYIAVFVCFASKTVHSETVNDYSTDSFLCSLNRFIGRRGLPKIIWCDNATNFVELPTLAASEAAIKAAKNLLLRNLGGEKLTHEELMKLLVHVEAVLNSRPIVAIGQDPSDEIALTPGHLLKL